MMKIVFGVFLVLLQELTEVHQILDLDQFSPKHQNFGLIPNVSLAPRKWTEQSFPAHDPVFLCNGHQASQTFLNCLQSLCSAPENMGEDGMWKGSVMLVNREHSCSITSTHYMFMESMNDAWINVWCSLWEVYYSNFNRRLWVPNSLLSSFMSLSLKRFLPWEFYRSLVQSWGHLPRSDFGTRGGSARQRANRIHRGAVQRLLPLANSFWNPPRGAWVHSLQRGLLWPGVAICECVIPRSPRRKPTSKKVLERPEMSTGKRERSCAAIWGEPFLSASLGKQPDRLKGPTPERGGRDPRPHPFQAPEEAWALLHPALGP